MPGKFFFGLLILSVIAVVFALPARSEVSSCSASLTPGTVYINDRFTLRFTLNNTSSSSIRWIKFTSPSENFEIASGSDSESAWSNISEPSNIIFHGSVLPDSWSSAFNVIIDTGDAPVSGNWTVQASDSPSGDNPAGCTGSLNLNMSDNPPDQKGPEISAGITISDVSTNSVKISWNTNENASSVLHYGLTADYGSELTNSALATAHSYSLTGLSPDTSYHFEIALTDSGGNETWTEDSTFTTAARPSDPVVITNTIVNTSVRTVSEKITDTKTILITPTPVIDRTPPHVTIATDLTKPFEQSSLISGNITDSSGIGKVEYSVDDGKNWLPVDEVGEPGKKYSGFTFLPDLSEDGNYKIRVRSSDLTGNVGYSQNLTLVIDRLAPRVGAGITSIGPQIMLPGEGGTLRVLAGIDQKIVLSAVGGPTSVDLIAREITAGSGQSEDGSEQVLAASISKGSESYLLPDTKQSIHSLAQNPDNGLWSGTLSFSRPGIYQLISRSVDGAGNRTEQQLSTYAVEKPGKIFSQTGGKALNGAKIEIYTLTASRKWALWTASAFGQTNPQTSKKGGSYRFVLPPGTYYAKISAPAHETLISDIFTLPKTMPFTVGFSLKKLQTIRLGFWDITLPSLFAQSAPVKISSSGHPIDSEPHKLSGLPAPSFILPSTSGEEFNSYRLRGKPSVITFVNTWAPQALEQIGLIQGYTPHAFNSAIVLSEETPVKAELFKKRGNYTTDFIVDKDGELVEPYKITALPAHFFLDRKGKIHKIVIGVLTTLEIESIISSY